MIMSNGVTSRCVALLVIMARQAWRDVSGARAAETVTNATVTGPAAFRGKRPRTRYVLQS